MILNGFTKNIPSSIGPSTSIIKPTANENLKEPCGTDQVEGLTLSTYWSTKSMDWNGGNKGNRRALVSPLFAWFCGTKTKEERTPYNLCLTC